MEPHTYDERSVTQFILQKIITYAVYLCQAQPWSDRCPCARRKFEINAVWMLLVEENQAVTRSLSK